jgi:ankyrin repeat protein
MMAASGTGNAAVVKLLLDKGVSADVVAGNSSPLITAIRNRKIAVVGLLLSRGADANFDASTGVSPLSWAVRTGDIDLAKALLQFGADPDKRNADGKSAVDEARDSPAMLQALSRHK